MRSIKLFTSQSGKDEFNKALKLAFRQEYINIYEAELNKLKGLHMSEKERIKVLLNSDLEEDYILGQNIIDVFKK